MINRQSFVLNSFDKWTLESPSIFDQLVLKATFEVLDWVKAFELLGSRLDLRLNMNRDNASFIQTIFCEYNKIKTSFFCISKLRFPFIARIFTSVYYLNIGMFVHTFFAVSTNCSELLKFSLSTSTQIGTHPWWSTFHYNPTCALRRCI